MKTDFGVEADRLETEIAAGKYDLPESLVAEKAALYQNAFVSWTKRDFRSYADALERHGRGAISSIATDVSSDTGKTQQEVHRYHEVFLKRYAELSDGQRIIDRVDKADKRVAREKEIKELLEKKIARHQDKIHTINFNYGPNKVQYIIS